MALVFQRHLAIPLWVVAFFAVVLTAPVRPMPPLTVLLGIAVMALMMMAMLQWRRTLRPLVSALPAPSRRRHHAGIVVLTVSGGTQVRTADRAATQLASDDVLDLVRMDDDGGWQTAREPALPTILIPGAREPGMLSTFGTPDANLRILDGPGTMDAVTTAERQREGGGAPNQRRRAGEASPWNPSHAMRQFVTATRALYARRFRMNQV